MLINLTRYKFDTTHAKVKSVKTGLLIGAKNPYIQDMHYLLPLKKEKKNMHTYK